MRRLLLLACAAGCGVADLGPMVRVVEGTPAGADVDPAAAPSIRFSGAVAPDGLLDGRLLLLVRASERAAALSGVEAEEGASAVPRVAADVALVEQATRLVLRPRAPLEAGVAWALVLSSRARSADGRRVLDADGHARPTVFSFTTAAPPPPAVLLTEVLADAATPEAGGEYSEVLNLGPGPLDLAGWRFEKRSAAGAWSGCTIGEGSGAPVPAGAVALVVGGAWDGRYGLPAGTVTFPCGATSLAGGIANDRAPVLRLLDPAGGVAAELDATAVPACPTALEVDPSGLTPGAAASCCRCTDGSPGWLSPPE